MALATSLLAGCAAPGGGLAGPSDLARAVCAASVRAGEGTVPEREGEPAAVDPTDGPLVDLVIPRRASAAACGTGDPDDGGLAIPENPIEVAYPGLDPGCMAPDPGEIWAWGGGISVWAPCWASGPRW
jgi:hypothetical protein